MDTAAPYRLRIVNANSHISGGQVPHWNYQGKARRPRWHGTIIVAGLKAPKVWNKKRPGFARGGGVCLGFSLGNREVVQGASRSIKLWKKTTRSSDYVRLSVRVILLDMLVLSDAAYMTTSSGDGEDWIILCLSLFCSQWTYFHDDPHGSWSTTWWCRVAKTARSDDDDARQIHSWLAPTVTGSEL